LTIQITNRLRVPLSDTALTLWCWLFPLTYLLHIAEEYFVGGGYAAHLLRLRGLQISTSLFLAAQGVGMVLMIAGIFLAHRFNFRNTLIVILGAVVFVNGITHLVTSLADWGYGPGLLTSLLLWIPLGSVTLFHFKGRISNRNFWLGVASGVGVNACIVLLEIIGG
jgi:uncharacterized protein with HXXEE motif